MSLVVVVVLFFVLLFHWPRHDVVSGDFYVARVYTGGRSGNHMLQMAFWYMMASQFQKPFIDPFYISGIGLDAGCKALGCPASSLKPPSYHDFGLVDGPFANRHVSQFDFRIKYISAFRGYFRKHVFNPDFSAADHDLVVHVRLEDVFDETIPHYTVTPLSFYVDAMKSITSFRSKTVHEIRTVAILARVTDKDQQEMLSAIVRLIKSMLTADSDQIQFQIFDANSVDEDFKILLKAKIVIGSVGSFFVMPCVLSHVAVVHVPWFTLYHDVEWVGDLSDDERRIDSESNATVVEYAADDGEFLRVWLHPLRITRKLPRHGWRKGFYDV